MKKLMIIGALVIALCVGLLAGCGGSADMYVFDLPQCFYKGAGFAESINTLNTPADTSTKTAHSQTRTKPT